MTAEPMTDGLDDVFESDEQREAYETFCAEQEAAECFQLDRPALVCRWRMARRHVPLLNRHIRALSHRRVSGEPLTSNMLSWAKQHVEWSLAEGSYEDPNGVLMLVIDVNGNAAMTVGRYEPLSDASPAALETRAAEARAEQAETGIAPELLACAEDGVLKLAAGGDEHLCGMGTLVEQLAQTRGIEVVRVGTDAAGFDEGGALLLISDEHGVVPAQVATPAGGAATEIVRFLQLGVAKLYA